MNFILIENLLFHDVMLSYLIINDNATLIFRAYYFRGYEVMHETTAFLTTNTAVFYIDVSLCHASRKRACSAVVTRALSVELNNVRNPPSRQRGYLYPRPCAVSELVHSRTQIRSRCDQVSDICSTFLHAVLFPHRKLNLRTFITYR